MQSKEGRQMLIMQELLSYMDRSSAFLTAQYLVDHVPEKSALDERDTAAVELINKLSGPLDGQCVGEAVLMGSEKISAAREALSGACPAEAVERLYKKNSAAALKLTEEHVAAVLDCLKNVQLTKEQIENVLTAAVLLSPEELSERTSLVLKHWDRDFLYYLMDEGDLLYPLHYVDVTGGIKRLLEALGAEGGRRLLEEHPEYLYLCKSEGYQDDEIYGPQHKKGLELLRSYQ